MMMEESEWINEYFMLSFNFGPKYVTREFINEMGSGVTIRSVHRFLESQNEKLRT